MSKPADRIATYDDLVNVPDNMVGEILSGSLVTHPRPSPKHSLAASAIGALLFTNFQSSENTDGWWILDEPECHLAADVVVPDIAGWRKATMPVLPETAWFDIPPDWVCEILSPATAKYDRGVKREIYAREKISYYWIVDPVERLIEVFAWQNGRWILEMAVTDEQTVHLPPFEQLPFDLSILWA